MPSIAVLATCLLPNNLTSLTLRRIRHYLNTTEAKGLILNPSKVICKIPSLSISQKKYTLYNLRLLFASKIQCGVFFPFSVGSCYIPLFMILEIGSLNNCWILIFLRKSMLRNIGAGLDASWWDLQTGSCMELMVHLYLSIPFLEFLGIPVWGWRWE